MENCLKHIIIILVIIHPCFALSQENNLDKIIETIIESMEEISGISDVTLIIEDLQELAEYPVNINATDEVELSRLHMLNDIQIKKLLKYIEEFGPAYSLFELGNVDGFSSDLLTKIEPFIWFGPEEKDPYSLGEAIRHGDHELLMRTSGTIQKAKGYLPGKNDLNAYEGNRFRYYTRYKFQSENGISAGFTGEKDPGEAFFHGSNKAGFDFYSAHASVKINPTIENVTIGDFIVRAGQGLVLWQEYSMGKSANVLNISKTNRGIRSYSSTDENRHFRGIAATIRSGNSSLSFFYSRKKVDGNTFSNDSVRLYFTSLQTSGYHRTINEIEDKNAILSKNSGALFTWNTNHLKFGATFSLQQFNLSFNRDNRLYNRFRFNGTNNYSSGLDYLFTRGKYHIFGEAAISKSKGKAFLQGAVMNLHEQLDLSILFRHMDIDYNSYWAGVFAEGSTGNNETGMFLGTRVLPYKYITLTAYSDFYRSKWFNYSTAGPSRGTDLFMQVNFKFKRKLEFYLRFKNEEKDQKLIEEGRYVNQPHSTVKTRLHFQHTLIQNLTFKTRFENVLFKGPEKENGIAVLQDIQFSKRNFPWNLSARFAWFSTDSYNTRIYVYENDLLYTFSVPAYFGRGIRSYLNIKYKPTKKTDIWLKISNYTYNDRQSISSGYNEIKGKNKTDLKLQFRLKI